MRNNGGDDLVVSSGATTFTFATRINSGAYSVTVKTQPVTSNCTVSNGSGTANIDITTVNVTCTKTLGTVTTLAGTAGVTGSADGTGTAAKFSQPHDLVSDGTNLYIADHTNYTVRKMVISTGEVTTLAGLAGSIGGADGIGSLARFGGVVGMTLMGLDLYAVDANRNTIRKINISTGQVITIAGTDGVANSSDGYGTSASFHYPTYICND